MENNEHDRNAPLWQHVSVLDKKSEGGGNKRFRCNYCNCEFTGSYSRVKAHLLKIAGFGIKRCTKVSNDMHRELLAQMEEVDRRNRPIDVPLSHQSISSSGSTPNRMFSGTASGSTATPTTYELMLKSMETKKRKSIGKGTLDAAFGNECRETLKGHIARMFYAGGLPFHFARNPYYLKAFTYAANTNLGGFIPPGYNSLRTTLLKKERANIDRLLQPIKDTWIEKGLSIVINGWTDTQRRPLINFMAVTESGPIFLKAINCEGEYKDKFLIAGLIKDTIAEVGAENVVQVITDNAPVCKAAGVLVEAQYPHIFWTPCVVHTLNLALKNICNPSCNPSPPRSSSAYDATYEQCKWITEVYDDVMFVKNFIMNHAMRLAMFNEFVNLKLLSVAETRFASVIVMLKRFKLIKAGLQSMVISDRWTCYREDDTDKAQVIKERLLNDLWWDKVTYILEFTGPIYDMLRFADTDKPALHLIYDKWDTMIEKVKEVIYQHERITLDETSEFYQVIYDILVSRWNKSTSPLHCLAHSLNPRYYSKDWLEKEPNRVPPHRDAEISDERNKCIRRFFNDPEDRKKANLEFARFSGASDSFANYDSLNDRGTFDARSWWVIYGSSAPMLQKIALKLLCQPCSSSCAERNWSTYSFIHSMRRNKILPQRAEDLVYVHTNLRLLSRKQEQYNHGESRLWDVCGDEFDPLDGAGELEIATLSLDEPDLEIVLFADDGNDDVVE